MPETRSLLMDSYEQDALLFAGHEHAMLQIERPEQGAPSSRQVELIEKAVADGSTAIIVLPQDPKTVGPALEAARERGISVVVLDLPVKAAGEPFTLVTQPPIAESARPMIDAVLAGVKKAKLSPQGPAVLVVNRDSAETVAEARTEGMRKALHDAGISDVSVVQYVQHSAANEAEHAASNEEFYRAMLDRTPRPSMVFAMDDAGIMALSQAKRADIEHNLKAPILGGLASKKIGLELNGSNLMASVVDMRTRPLLEQAILTAIKLFRGESIESPIRVARPVRIKPDLREALPAEPEPPPSE